MRNLDVDKYKKVLEQERARIHQEIEVIEHQISYDEGEGQSELADYDNHPGDSGTETFEKEKDVAILDNWRNDIGKIDEALGKIERNTYGECDRCGKPIAIGRLDAVPWALFCVDCQDIIEGS